MKSFYDAIKSKIKQDRIMSRQKKHSNISGGWTCTTPGTVVSLTAGTVLLSLLQSIDFSCLCGDPATCIIQTVTVDSRKSGRAVLFLALCGFENDGHDFVKQALDCNCSAILVEKGRLSKKEYRDCDACIIEVDDSRSAYASLAEMIFSFPAREMAMIAVTGTNGKTSVSYLLESVLQQAGKQVGVLGTINYRYSNALGQSQVLPAPFTTPEPLLLQEILRKMADAGVESVIMEVSSHGLEQNRIGGLMFDVVAFSNLSRDHLDYHIDMESYFKAKTLLFTRHLKNNARAVICFTKGSAEWSKRLQEICRIQSTPLTTCGMVGCDIFPLSVNATLKQTEMKLEVDGEVIAFTSPLVGAFNVDNLQTCFAMALASGVSISIICDALSRSTGAPGRMERVRASAGEQVFRPTVFVDYAHTPDALQQVLKTVKSLPHNRLTCVFGCGGDRDSGKRLIMGEMCGKYADVAIVTDDNPRTEDPAIILQMVSAGVQKTDLPKRNKQWLQTRDADERGFVVIPDRKLAIEAAIDTAGAGDIVLIAGKGHEEYQVTNRGKRFFNDTLEAQNGLCKWNLHSLVLATKGKCVEAVGHAVRISGTVSTDSRKIKNGDIFVALKGERFDAHDYVSDVASRGAGCCVLEREPENCLSVPFILVQNGQKALGDLAAYRRNCLKEISAPKVVGITGSSGKTTVKEMCFAIFNQRWPDRKDRAESRVLKTEGNFNNLIGLPLSLLPIEAKHKAVILEMGMNQPGEIERLTAIADPDIACILNIHGAHLQGLGTIEGVAAAKAELFRTCAAESVLVVNNDDPRVLALSEECEQKKIHFGVDPAGIKSLDIYISSPETGINEEIHFILHIAGEQRRVKLQVPGQHNISNALAAAGIAFAAGIGISDIAAGLATFQPANSRMQILEGPGGTRIINDTYNANPESMKAGIRTLAGLGVAPRVAILGDMFELGNDSGELHKQIGYYVGKQGIDFLAVLGEYAENVAKGVRESGCFGTTVRVVESQEQCNDWVQELIGDEKIQTGSYILVKASRGMRMENLVEQLRKGIV
jgi:murE/murF fusion protein